MHNSEKLLYNSKMYILIKILYCIILIMQWKKLRRLMFLIKEALTLFQCKEIEGSKDDMSNDW